MLEVVRLETERQAIEEDPDLIKQFVDAQREIDLKAYAACADERARAQVPPRVAELDAAGYQVYLQNCRYYHNTPKSFAAWSDR